MPFRRPKSPPPARSLGISDSLSLFLPKEVSDGLDLALKILQSRTSVSSNVWHYNVIFDRTRERKVEIIADGRCRLGLNEWKEGGRRERKRYDNIWMC